MKSEAVSTSKGKYHYIMRPLKLLKDKDSAECIEEIKEGYEKSTSRWIDWIKIQYKINLKILNSMQIKTEASSLNSTKRNW